MAPSHGLSFSTCTLISPFWSSLGNMLEFFFIYQILKLVFSYLYCILKSGALVCDEFQTHRFDLNFFFGIILKVLCDAYLGQKPPEALMTHASSVAKKRQSPNYFLIVTFAVILSNAKQVTP